MVTLFTYFIVLQFAVILSHDLVDVSDWVRGSQVQALVGKRKVWFATFANAALPGTAVLFALVYWHRAKPAFVPTYWLIYCGIALLSAVGMWYVPYFRGADEKQKNEYLTMYAGTRHILPPRGNNPRPNAFHIGIHVLFVMTFGLAVAIRFHGA